MKLTITTHLWFSRLAKTLGSLFGFTVDLTGLSIDDDEVMLDLSTGRD